LREEGRMPRLKYLKSTNQGGTRKVCVTAVAGNSDLQATLEFQICHENFTQPLSIAANQRAEVCQEHDLSGECWVIVRLVGTDVTTAKFLDLDEAEDF